MPATMNPLFLELLPTILLNIVTARKEVNDINMPLGIISISEDTDKKYCPNDIGTIEIQYNTRGWEALYGFDAAGNVQCYQD